MFSKYSKISIIIVIVLALLVGIGAVSASFTNNGDGTGFIGKGDVQIVFGWNNKQMQTNHEAITFSYQSSATYSFDCEWWTGPERNRKYHEVSVTAVIGLNATVANVDRKTGQWTGWFLSGLPTGSVGAPELSNDDCGAEGNEMKSIVEGSIQLVEGSETSGLFASFQGDTRQVAS